MKLFNAAQGTERFSFIAGAIATLWRWLGSCFCGAASYAFDDISSGAGFG